MYRKAFVTFFLLISVIAVFADGPPSYFFSSMEKASVYASSYLVEKGRPQNAYAPEKAVDRDEKTGWCAGNKNPGGIGAWIEFTFPPETADYISIIPGFTRSRHLYYANNRIKDYEMIVTFANGRIKKIKDRLPDEDYCGRLRCSWESEYPSEEDKKNCRKENENICQDFFYYRGSSGVQIPLNEIACIKSVRFWILSVYPGSKYNDTCISEFTLVQENPIVKRYRVEDLENGSLDDIPNNPCEEE